MPAPQFRSAGLTAGGTTSVTPSLPDGIAANDVMFLLIESSGTAQDTDPTGWSNVVNSPVVIAATNTVNLEVKWRRVVNPALEVAPTITDRGDHTFAVIVAYSGVATTGDPWEVGGVASYADQASTTGANGPALTTTVSSALVLDIRADGRDQTGARWTGYVNADLRNITERLDAGTAFGDGGGLSLADGERVNFGSVAGMTATFFTAVSASKAVMALALRPAVPTATLRPNGTVSNGWTVTNAATAHEALDDAVTQPTTGSEADGYIATSTQNASCLLDLTSATLPANEKVTAIRVWAEGTNVNATGDEKIRTTLELPNIEPKLVTSTDWTPTTGGAYGWQQTATITGAAINQTDLDALRVRFQMIPGTGTATQVRLRVAYVEVDYVARTGAGATGVSLLTNPIYTTGTDAYTFTTASYTPVIDRPMYVWVVGAHASEAIPIPAVSGNGQTWTHVHTAERPGAPTATRRMFLFRSSGAAASAGGFTANFDAPLSGTRPTTALDLAMIAVTQVNAATGTALGSNFAGGDDTFDLQQGGFLSGFNNNDSGVIAAFVTSTTDNKVPETGWTELAEVNQDPMGFVIVTSAQPDSTPLVSWTGTTAHGATSVLELTTQNEAVPPPVTASILTTQVM